MEPEAWLSPEGAWFKSSCGWEMMKNLEITLSRQYENNQFNTMNQADPTFF